VRNDSEDEMAGSAFRQRRREPWHDATLQIEVHEDEVMDKGGKDCSSSSSGSNGVVHSEDI
jgi:hypothetical protein